MFLYVNLIEKQTKLWLVLNWTLNAQILDLAAILEWAVRHFEKKLYSYDFEKNTTYLQGIDL